MVAQLMKKLATFYQILISLPCSYNPAIGPYPKANESSPHPLILLKNLASHLDSSLSLDHPVSDTLVGTFRMCRYQATNTQFVSVETKQ
jgi:hypothetical protein